jgi:hypothetical protein
MTGALSGAMTPGGGPTRAAQPITFQDFLQVVDMQFLDHIRRGTSINMMDLAPGPVPNDLAEALKVRGCGCWGAHDHAPTHACYLLLCGDPGRLVRVICGVSPD